MSEGKPVLIITSDFELNESDLIRILQHDEIKDRFVVVISVAGAFRKGKSFLLGFFIRYLNAMYVKKDASNWMGTSDQPLQGFTWTNSPERETTGIWMWSDIFLHEINGEKIAIILLDTQGVFDSKTTQKSCAVIFALSTLLSSVQIYNISGNIQEDDLQHLELFTGYGKLAVEDTGSKPFQELLFLIRDWSYKHSFEYGPIGGNRMINHYLQTSDKQNEELRNIRKNLRDCFSKIECFLMPHPGMKMVSNEHFAGKLEDMSEKFKDELNILVQMVLSPDQLMLKEINGKKVRSKELVQFFRLYLEVLAGDELPKPKTLFDATAELNHLSSFNECKEVYIKQMGELCGNPESCNSEEFVKIHETIKGNIIEMFDSQKKMGGPEMSDIYKSQLIVYLDSLFNVYRQQNNDKNEMIIALEECDILTLSDQVKNHYILEIENVLQGKPYAKKEELSKFHNEFEKKHMEMFSKKCDDFGIDYKDHEEKLEKELNDLLKVFWSKNETKRILYENQMNAEYSKILNDTIDSYGREMERKLNEQPLPSTESFDVCHMETMSRKVREMILKFDNESDSQTYTGKLENHLNNTFVIFRRRLNDKKRIFQAESDAENLRKLQECRSSYVANMNRFLNQSQNVNVDQLNREHNINKANAVDHFRNTCIKNISYENHLRSLAAGIDEIYLLIQSQVSSHNQSESKSWMSSFMEILVPVLDVVHLIFSRKSRRTRSRRVPN